MTIKPIIPDENLVGYWPLDEDSGSITFDYGSGGNNGIITGADRIKLTNGQRGLDFVSTNSDKVAFGDIGTIKSFGGWFDLDTTTEVIAEARAATGLLLASGGILSYADFDNAYVDGEDTDIVTVGSHLLVFTSTTNITASALTLGINDTTYGDFKSGFIFASSDKLTQEEIKAIHKKTYRR